MPFDLELASRHFQALRALVVRHAGGAQDTDLVDKLSARRRAAAACIDDAECRDHLRAFERYARDLFSDWGHQRWAGSSLSGAAVLRLQMLGEIDACMARLAEMQAWRDDAGGDPRQHDTSSDE